MPPSKLTPAERKKWRELQKQPPSPMIKRFMENEDGVVPVLINGKRQFIKASKYFEFLDMVMKQKKAQLRRLLAS
jgi:hypothetical protein